MLFGFQFEHYSASALLLFRTGQKFALCCTLSQSFRQYTGAVKIIEEIGRTLDTVLSSCEDVKGHKSQQYQTFGRFVELWTFGVVPKIRGPFLGVPIIRTVICLVSFCGVSLFGETTVCQVRRQETVIEIGNGQDTPVASITLASCERRQAIKLSGALIG